jgi:hypothetical protein
LIDYKIRNIRELFEYQKPYGIKGSPLFSSQYEVGYYIIVEVV